MRTPSASQVVRLAGGGVALARPAVAPSSKRSRRGGLSDVGPATEEDASGEWTHVSWSFGQRLAAASLMAALWFQTRKGGGDSGSTGIPVFISGAPHAANAAISWN